MSRAKINNGELTIEPSQRLSLLWSYNPLVRFESPHEMVGSVFAHMGHIDIYGAVYWSLDFTVSSKTLDEFEYPLSGYLYNSATQSVEYRARVVDMSPGPRKPFLPFVPPWRTASTKRKNLYILIDQIDKIFPSRLIDDFNHHDDGRPVEGPPSSNYFRIKDPMF